MVGETSLVQLGALLLELCRRPFSRGFLLGHTSTALGELRLLTSLVRGLTMLACDLLTPLSQLALAGGNPRTFTRPRKEQSESDQYKYDDDNDDDQCC